MPPAPHPFHTQREERLRKAAIIAVLAYILKVGGRACFSLVVLLILVSGKTSFDIYITFADLKRSSFYSFRHVLSYNPSYAILHGFSSCAVAIHTRW